MPRLPQVTQHRLARTMAAALLALLLILPAAAPPPNGIPSSARPVPYGYCISAELLMELLRHHAIAFRVPRPTKVKDMGRVAPTWHTSPAAVIEFNRSLGIELPNDPEARILMVCTGTGSAPFRAFTMHRQRMKGVQGGDMVLFFGARTPDSLPYFGPLNKVPDRLLKKHMVFSRIPGVDKEYVQDRMMVEQEVIAEMIADAKTHIYICGLKGMEVGVDHAFANIAESAGISWNATRDAMREDGRYHVETY